MELLINKKVFPGAYLAKRKNQRLGYGLYQKDGEIFASVFGVVELDKSLYQVVNNFSVKKVGLRTGDIVYGKVTRVKEEECLVEILQIGSVWCGAKDRHTIEATIRKENVREKMIDSVVMVECFHPRDIVKAKVLSLGDSIRSLYLSTASENLGVLVAEHEETTKLMLPFDWNTMVDPQNSLKESRKVCKPQS